MSRKSVVAALVGALALSTLVACGGSATSGQQPADAAASGAFPVTIKHKFGSSTIPAQPQRIVVLSTGSDDIDAVYALGATPVGISKDSYNDSGVYPWLKGSFDPAKTKLIDISTGVNYEQVAALQPDLILATGHYELDKDYAKLSGWAPTIGYESEWGKQSWQEHVRVVGKALGRAAKADEVIATTAKAIAAVRTANPGLAGKTFSASVGNTAGKIYTLVNEDDFAVRFLKELGLVKTPGLADVKPEAPGTPTGSLSFELVGKLDADLVVIAFTSADLRQAFENSPLVKNMSAVRSGRYQVVDMETIAQLRNPSALGISWLLEGLRPYLAKAGA